MEPADNPRATLCPLATPQAPRLYFYRWLRRFPVQIIVNILRGGCRRASAIVPPRDTAGKLRTGIKSVAIFNAGIPADFLTAIPFSSLFPFYSRRYSSRLPCNVLFVHSRGFSVSEIERSEIGNGINWKSANWGTKLDDLYSVLYEAQLILRDLRVIVILFYNLCPL